MPYSRGDFTANTAQSAAITHPPAPLMIIAGAGTGKTTTLIQRIIHLIEHYALAPENLLVITYTEKAADELKNRIIAEIGAAAEKLTVGTFHAFCYGVVREFAFQPERPPVLMEEGDALFMLLDRFDELAPFESREFPQDPVRTVSNSFLPFFNHLRDALIDPARQSVPSGSDDESEEPAAQLQDLTRVYGIFQDWKRAEGLVDYGDMIQLCQQLLDDPAILVQLQERYRHLIIDEFQDNNFALNAVIGKLAENRGSITVVGDDDQVIYSFRGASAYNIQDFQARYRAFTDYREIALVENYRSVQPILNAANVVIANNHGRQPKTLVNPHRPTGDRPLLYIGDTTTQNGNLPAIIDELLAQGRAFGDIAVLCRTRAQAREAARQLQRVHLPVSIFLTDYFHLPVIRDLLAWCQVVADGPQADNALYRLLIRTIGPAAARSLYGAYSRRDLTSRLRLLRDLADDPAQLPQPVIDLIRRIDDLRQHLQQRRKTAGEMVWEIFRATALLRPYARRYEYTDQIALTNVGDLIARAQEFSRRHYNDNSLERFLRFMATLQRADAIPAMEPPRPAHLAAITVQTVHKAKGLEYPVVIVPYNQSQRFPLNYRPDRLTAEPPPEWQPFAGTVDLPSKDLHRQEERRLFYVAITRARERLILLAPEKRCSPFIKEIPTELTRRIVMEPVIADNGQDVYNELRVAYEQRLNAALSQDQFDTARDLIAALEQLTAVTRGESIAWGSTDWERELQGKLAGQPLPEVPAHPVLSASAIETYAACPLKYRLGYIDNVPETASKPQLTFGNIIHQVLEHFHREGDGTEVQLLELLDRFWQSEGFDYQSRELSFREQAVEILKNYFRYFQASPPQVLETEYKFKFDLDFCTIRGKIDRIDREGAGIGVVDYKTSKKPSEPKDSLQLAVYCLFLARQSDREPGGLPEKASLLFLRQAEPEFSHRFSVAELDEFLNKIREVVGGINQRRFDPEKGMHCDWCDYKELLCPAWEDRD
ncbi:MAG: ATP-dependent DNA helicase [Candidatus Neomarinimicrobiota bacterium]